MVKILAKNKDGGPESNAVAYWLIEWKRFFSIGLLSFTGQSRDVFHSHAFDSVSWLIKGELEELFKDDYKSPKYYKPSIKPIIVLKEDFHKVSSWFGTSWAITFRGPWNPRWFENSAKEGTYTLTNGRVRDNG